ncbi:MAG TPA: tetratricopeptide repeat protein, partial [Patescibacteria group bacterium]|nr:tetratricopeptide repeat protein [Patescibacteria group bacterium]
YWLGRAYLALHDPPHAIAQFEEARSIDPSHVEARRELVRLYADARRYAEAAEELRAITGLVPDDKDAAFLLAACLRAAGRRDDAIAAYAEAAVRFADEPRFHTFRADLMSEAGRSEEARHEYEAARRLAPRDARLVGILDAPDAPATRDLLGGGPFVAAIAAGTDRAGRMESSRSTYMLAINDAILDLQINGAEACRDGHGASSALLAREEGARYWTLGQEMTSASRGIRAALDRGEGAALTPDEARSARDVLAAMDASERDVREMRSLFQGTFIPLYRRRACETFDGPIGTASLASVRARYADREVTLPEVRPPTWSMPISPVVPSMPARSITFRVNNAEGRVTYVLTIDGTEMGEVAPGRRDATFSARLGPHRLCLVPRGVRCGDPGTERTVFLHERWTIRVRPGST